MDMQTALETPTGARYGVLAGFLGWTLDAFDFFVLVFVLSAVAKDLGAPFPPSP